MNPSEGTLAAVNGRGVLGVRRAVPVRGSLAPRRRERAGRGDG